MTTTVKKSETEGLEVKDLRKFVARCRSAILSATSRSVREKVTYSPYQQIYEFRDDLEAVQDGAGVDVFPLPMQPTGDPLWASVRLQLNRSGTRLKHVQIRLLFGERTASKESFLRMEWDSRDAPDPTDGHAQPHWQVEPPFIDGTVDFDSFDDPALLIHPGNYRDNLHRMHLAMAATFHQRMGHWSVPKPDATPEAIAYWLKACLAYSIREMQYVIRKMGAGDQSR